MRIFVAHSKAASDAEIDQLVEMVRARARAKGLGNVEVVSGKDDFQVHFPALRSRGGDAWHAWRQRWATGVGADGTPTYSTIVVPDDAGESRCGRATALGVRMALGRRPVTFFDRTAGRWAKVIDVVCTDLADEARGYELRLAAESSAD